MNTVKNFLSVFFPLFIIFNLCFYIFGLFYNLNFNPVEWSAKQRGAIAAMNCVMAFLSLIGSLGEK